MRAAIEGDEVLARQREGHTQHAALRLGAAVRGVAHHVADRGLLPAAAEGGDIEVRGVFRLVIQPEAGCDLGHAPTPPYRVVTGSHPRTSASRRTACHPFSGAGRSSPSDRLRRAPPSRATRSTRTPRSLPPRL